MQCPQLLAAYVPNVDTDGHKYGPNSTVIRSTIAMLMICLTSLSRLAARNLSDIVNVVVVSDHGMASYVTPSSRSARRLIDVDLIERIDGWPLRGLHPKRPGDLPQYTGATF